LEKISYNSKYELCVDIDNKVDIIYTVCVIEEESLSKESHKRVVQTQSSLCEASFDGSHRYGNDLQTMSSYELKFSLIVVFQSRGDDVTDVTEISG